MESPDLSSMKPRETSLSPLKLDSSPDQGSYDSGEPGGQAGPTPSSPFLLPGTRRVSHPMSPYTLTTASTPVARDDLDPVDRDMVEQLLMGWAERGVLGRRREGRGAGAWEWVRGFHSEGADSAASGYRTHSHPTCHFYSYSVEALFARMQAHGLVQERTWRFKTYKSCVVGRDVVSWWLEVGQVASREEGVELGKFLIAEGYMKHVTESHDFKDDFLFYHLLIPGATRRNSVTDSDGQISVTHSVSSNSLDAESPAALAKPDTPDVVADRRASATVDVREYSDQSFEYRRVGIADPSKAKRIGTRPKEEAKAADIETIAVTGESPKPSGPDPNAVVKAGFLVKQGHRFKNWRRRWFVLRGHYLFYYKKQKDTKEAGSIDLLDCSLEKAAGAKSPLCMRLVSRTKSDSEYLLVAETNTEFVSWVTTLDSVIREWRDWATGAGRSGVRSNHSNSVTKSPVALV